MADYGYDAEKYRERRLDVENGLPAPPREPKLFEPSTIESKKDSSMDVLIIWGITADAPDAPWVINAWDTESIDGHPDGWAKALADAEAELGGRYVRVTRTRVNYDTVVAAFQPTVV